MYNQFSWKKYFYHDDKIVVPRGLEPRTLWLLAIRSDQLSYETSWKDSEESCGIELRVTARRTRFGAWQGQRTRFASMDSESGHVCKRISGLVVEYVVAIDVTRVRFPADAFLVVFRLQWLLCFWKNDSDGVRTRAGRAHWISSPTP